MRELTAREKWLIGVCFAVIFLVANAFAARSVLGTLRGGASQLEALRNELADHELRLEDLPRIEARERWLEETMPSLGGDTLGRAQGDLLQSLQDDVFERKLQIEQQSLQDIVREPFYTEVAVRLTVRGEESEVVGWLQGLQSPEKFQVVKSLDLRLDRSNREAEPQVVCQITIARWFAPAPGGALAGPPSPGRDALAADAAADRPPEERPALP